LLALFRRRLGRHVDDLNAAVGRVHRCVRILRFGLAIADGDEIGAVDAVFLGEVALDGIGAALRQVLVVAFAADRIGVPGDDEGRAVQARVRERLCPELRARLVRYPELAPSIEPVEAIRAERDRQ
jgi:hypothetical protein